MFLPNLPLRFNNVKTSLSPTGFTTSVSWEGRRVLAWSWSQAEHQAGCAGEIFTHLPIS